MNNNPLVSAVIIFLNGEPFIEEAIKSILDQTYSDWELWLVDDGSTDGSTRIAKDYAERYPSKIFYVDHPNHENRGMSASRNLGIAHSRGDYLALLDADDVWLPTKLEKQLELMALHPEVGMVYGPTHYWYGWTQNPADSKLDYIKDMRVKPGQVYNPPSLVKTLLKDGGVIPGNCSLLIKMALTRQVGAFEEKFRSIYEDQVFFVKVCLKAPVYISKDVVAKYRQHPDSACHTAEVTGDYHPEKPNPSHLAFLKWLEAYLQKEQVQDKGLWQILRLEFLKYRNLNLYKIRKYPDKLRKNFKTKLRAVARRVVPRSLYNSLKALYQGKNYTPVVGAVRFGDFRRLEPINWNFGFDRGLPVDRYYIENFLENNSKDVFGKALEIGDNYYTTRYGKDRITASEVLHVAEGNPAATMVGDLVTADFIPSDSFDCVILTQTLQLIYEPKVALQTVHRILKPGGVLLATFPGITHIGDQTWESSWYWNFTGYSAQTLFSEVFGAENIQVETKGNVLAATSFLQGLCAEELTPEELDYNDPAYQVLISVRAVKGS